MNVLMFLIIKASNLIQILTFILKKGYVPLLSIRQHSLKSNNRETKIYKAFENSIVVKDPQSKQLENASFTCNNYQRIEFTKIY